MLTPDEIVIREYKEGDEAQINFLHNQEYGTNRGIEEWRWEFRDGPYGESIFVVAEFKGEIIGMYGLLPVHLSWCEQVVPSAKAEEMVVNKEFRGQGVLKRVSDRIFDLAAQKGIALIWGMTSAEKVHIGIGYQIPGRLSRAILILDPTQTYQILKNRIPVDVKRRLPSQVGQKLLRRAFALLGFLWFKTRSRKINLSSRFKVVPITQADDRLDIFWEAFRQKGNFYTIARTSNYLDWRIFGNPNVTYQFLAAVEGDSIQGYVILSRSKHEPVGYITDFCVLEEHFEGVAGLLISRAVEYFLSQGIAFVSAWHVGNNPESKRYSSWLKKFGFLSPPIIESCIVLKVLAKEESLPAEPSDLDNWFITELFSEGAG